MRYIYYEIIFLIDIDRPLIILPIIKLGKIEVKV